MGQKEAKEKIFALRRYAAPQPQQPQRNNPVGDVAQSEGTYNPHLAAAGNGFFDLIRNDLYALGGLAGQAGQGVENIRTGERWNQSYEDIVANAEAEGNNLLAQSMVSPEERRRITGSLSKEEAQRRAEQRGAEWEKPFFDAGNAIPELQANRDATGSVEQFVLDMERNAPQFLQGLAGPVGGTAMMAANIAGQTNADLRRKGYSQDAAMSSGLFNAAVQTPMESFSMGKVTRGLRDVLKGRSKLAYQSLLDKNHKLTPEGKSKLKDWIGTIATESGTEFVQEYPDAMTEDIAASIESGTLIKDLPGIIAKNTVGEKADENLQNALYAGLLGGVMGGTVHGVGTVAELTARKLAGKRNPTTTEIAQARAEAEEEIAQAQGNTGAMRENDVSNVQNMNNAMQNINGNVIQNTNGAGAEGIHPRANAVVQFLSNKGLSPEQAAKVGAAMAGNIYQESGYDPTAENEIGAYGSFQFLGDRRNNLLSFAENNGLDPSDFNTQLEYAWHEMNREGTLENRALQEMLAAKDVDGATLAFRKLFERPGEEEANDEARVAEARNVYDKYTQARQYLIRQSETMDINSETDEALFGELERIAREGTEEEVIAKAEELGFKAKQQERQEERNENVRREAERTKDEVPNAPQPAAMPQGQSPAAAKIETQASRTAQPATMQQAPAAQQTVQRERTVPQVKRNMSRFNSRGNFNGRLDAPQNRRVESPVKNDQGQSAPILRGENQNAENLQTQTTQRGEGRENLDVYTEPQQAQTAENETAFQNAQEVTPTLAPSGRGVSNIAKNTPKIASGGQNGIANKVNGEALERATENATGAFSGTSGITQETDAKVKENAALDRDGTVSMLKKATESKVRAARSGDMPAKTASAVVKRAHTAAKKRLNERLAKGEISEETHGKLSKRAKELADESISAINGESASENGNISTHVLVEQNIENGNRAMQKVIETHSDVEAAMHRDDVGDIDFIWGTPGRGKEFKHGEGISHIIAKHTMSEGKDSNTILKKIVDVLARGTDKEIQTSNNGSGEARMRIHYDGYTVILSAKNESRNAWLLTGWEDNVKETSVNASDEVYDSDTATAARLTLTRSGRDTDVSTSNIEENSQNVKEPLKSQEKADKGKEAVSDKGHDNGEISPSEFNRSTDEDDSVLTVKQKIAEIAGSIKEKKLSLKDVPSALAKLREKVTGILNEKEIPDARREKLIARVNELIDWATPRTTDPASLVGSRHDNEAYCDGDPDIAAFREAMEPKIQALRNGEISAKEAKEYLQLATDSAERGIHARKAYHLISEKEDKMLTEHLLASKWYYNEEIKKSADTKKTKQNGKEERKEAETETKDILKEKPKKTKAQEKADTEKDAKAKEILTKDAHDSVYAPIVNVLEQAQPEVAKAARDTALLMAKTAEILHKRHGMKYKDAPRVLLGGNAETGANEYFSPAFDVSTAGVKSVSQFMEKVNERRKAGEEPNKIRYTGKYGVSYSEQQVIHAMQKHDLTDKQMDDIETHINVLQNTSLSNRGDALNGKFHGKSVLCRVDGKLGSYYVVLEVTNSNGMVWFKTAMSAKKEAIDNIIAEHSAGRLSSEDAGTTSQNDSAISIESLPEALGIVKKDLSFNQPAWHGSPYTFDAFDLSKIGNGEGHQAHGWGLYFAEDRKVSEEYKNKLAKTTIGLNGEKYIAEVQGWHVSYRSLSGSIIKEDTPLGLILSEVEYQVGNGKFSKEDVRRRFSHAVSYWERDVKEYEGKLKWANAQLNRTTAPKPTPREIADREYDVRDFSKKLQQAKTYLSGFQKAMQLIDELKEDEISISFNNSRLYEVDVPDYEVLIDEQKLYENQSKTVKKVLQRIIKDINDENRNKWREPIKLNNKTGRQIYNMLSRILGSDRRASLFLNEHGIKGISYVGRQDGRCFVVFDDKAVKILNTYEQQVKEQIAGLYNVSENLIKVFTSGNASTVLHESAHWYLTTLENLLHAEAEKRGITGTTNEILKELAEDGTVSGELVSDLQKIRNWGRYSEEVMKEYKGTELEKEFNRLAEAVKNGDEYAEERFIQERFARAYERYLASGKAPAKELQGAFNRFRKWLLDIYETIKNLGNKPAPKEIQDIFDRMLAMNEQQLKIDEAVTSPRYTMDTLFSVQGNKADAMRRQAKMIPDTETTDREKGIVAFGRKMGATVVFFEGNKNLHGWQSGDVIFLNRDSAKDLNQVFWHESFHWLKRNNSALYEQLEKAVLQNDDIAAQVEAWREKTGRTDLTEEEAIEEMLADAMGDASKRGTFFEMLGVTHPTLVQKIIRWLKNAYRDLVAQFRHTEGFKPEAGLTNTQINRMSVALDNMALELVDGNGNKLFSTDGDGNLKTNAVEDARYADGVKHLVTNKNLKADDVVKVVHLLSGGIDIENENVTQRAKRLTEDLMGKQFKLQNDDITLKADDKDNVNHFIVGRRKTWYQKGKKRVLSKNKNIKRLIENSVYVESRQSYHEDKKDLDYVKFYAVGEVSGRYIRFEIGAYKDHDGTYTVSSVSLYNLQTKGDINPSAIKKGSWNTHHQNGGDFTGSSSSFFIKIADMLEGVKDEDNNLYVINGVLQFEPKLLAEIQAEEKAKVEQLVNLIQETGIEVITDKAEMERVLGEKLTDFSKDNIIQKMIISYAEGERAPDLTMVSKNLNGRDMYGVAFVGEKPKNYVPKKIGKAYKLMELYPDGTLHALFAGVEKAHKLGEWNWAQGFTPDEKGAIKTMNLAPRYGWHMGTGVPASYHLMGVGDTLNPKMVYPSKGGIGHPKGSKRVWVEVHYDATNDYTDIAEQNPGREKDIRGLIPFGGYYIFQEGNLSNWIIASGIKFDHVLSEAERNKILEEAGYNEELVWRKQVLASKLKAQLTSDNKKLAGEKPLGKNETLENVSAHKQKVEKLIVENEEKIKELNNGKDWKYKKRSEADFAAERARIRKEVFDNPEVQNAQLLTTSDGTVYGFVEDGKIYLDPSLMNSNTPIHECTHIWDNAVMQKNPKLWARGVELLKQTSLWEEVANDPLYADIANDENLLASEVHARLTGEKGASVLNKTQASQGVKEALKKWLNDFWSFIKDTFAEWSEDDLAQLTIEDFTAMPIGDLIKGTKIGGSEEAVGKAKGTEENNEEVKLSVDLRDLSEGQVFRDEKKNQAAKAVTEKMEIGQDSDIEHYLGKFLGKAFRRKKAQKKAQMEKNVELDDAALDNIKEKRSNQVFYGVMTSIMSPSRIKDPIFKSVFTKAEEAKRTQNKLYSKWTEKHKKILDLIENAADYARYVDVLLSEDAQRKVFTDDELREMGCSNKVIDAHKKVRALLKEIRAEIAKVYLAEHVETKNFATKAEADAWAKSPFFKDVDIKQMQKSNGMVWQVKYTTPQYTRANETLFSWELEKLQKDGDVYVMEAVPTDMEETGETMYSVRYLKQQRTLADLDQYLPHFFHDFLIIAQDNHGKRVVGSGTTLNEAVQAANGLAAQKENEGIIFSISPKGFSFEDGTQELGIIGDKNLDELVSGIKEDLTISLDEAREAVKGKGKHVFLSALQHRKGAKGWETNLRWVIQHHVASSARYCGLEPFKSSTINTFERAYGSFEDNYLGKNPKAEFMQGYINSILGMPTKAEQITNAMLSYMSWFEDVPRPSRAVTSSVLGVNSCFKLGASMAAAFVNLTQFINLQGYIGNKWTYEGMRRTWKKSPEDMALLEELGTHEETGLETVDVSDETALLAGRFNKELKALKKLADISMTLFTKAESFLRSSAILGAYHKAIAEGKTKGAARAYALKVNRNVNFNYGVEDEPRVFRALKGSIVGDLFLQFKKYGMKEMEVIVDMVVNKSIPKKQKVQFFGEYILLAGMFNALPFQEALMDLLGFAIDSDDPEAVVKEWIMEKSGDDYIAKKAGLTALYGVGGLIGIDISQRVGFRSLVPELDNPLGVTGSTITQVCTALSNGDPIGFGKAISPAVGNTMSTAAGYNTDSKGRVAYVYKDPYERAMRFLGFRTIGEATSVDKQRIITERRKQREKARKEAKEAYLENPTYTNKRRLKDLGYTEGQIKNMKSDNTGAMERTERLKSRMTKQEKKDYKDIMDW